MSKDTQPNVQEAFLNHLRKSKQPITVFLTNGVKLQGKLTWFDNFCLTLTRDGVTQLVYKHGISTVMPGDTFDISDLAGFDNDGNC
ncbi:MAG: host factor-I protein [Alphaproteobacteria bacterium]|jgi:host factor-I protein